MLAHLRLLLHISIFYNISYTLASKLYCDNLGIIIQINKAKAKLNPSPRQYLIAEIDVEMQILDTLQIFNIEVCEIIHVLGHQYAKEKQELLAWDSQINIYCDNLATKKIKSITTPSCHVPMLPTSKIALKINDFIITHHLPRQIWQQ